MTKSRDDNFFTCGAAINIFIQCKVMFVSTFNGILVGNLSVFFPGQDLLYLCGVAFTL